jgi:hypothetical protein
MTETEKAMLKMVCASIAMLDNEMCSGKHCERGQQESCLFEWQEGMTTEDEACKPCHEHIRIQRISRTLHEMGGWEYGVI